MDLMNFSAKALHYSSNVVLKVWQGFSTMATENKLPKTLKRIGTHSGIFHCDEALACYMLRQLPEYQDAEIIRTRVAHILDTCDIVVDVGATYSPKTNRFDHHQKRFEETLSTVRPDLTKNKTIKLSSAGLVYAHFGHRVIGELLKQQDLPVAANCLDNIFLHVYNGFIEEVDAIDNGIPMQPEGKSLYRINTDLSARVRKLIPAWNSLQPESLDKLFEEAIKLTGSEFKDKVLEAATVWWPARQVVRSAIESRKQIHPSGEIILLQNSCPWKDHIYTLEEEYGLKDHIKFLLFPDGDTWRVQAVPIQTGSFVCRVFLHKDWRGVRDEQLSDIAGVPGCLFCHGTGFIGGNKSREGALQMAVKSLNAPAAAKE